jgi:hypothetical protein
MRARLHRAAALFMLDRNNKKNREAGGMLPPRIPQTP